MLTTTCEKIKNSKLVILLGILKWVLLVGKDFCLICPFSWYLYSFCLLVKSVMSKHVKDCSIMGKDRIQCLLNLWRFFI